MARPKGGEHPQRVTVRVKRDENYRLIPVNGVWGGVAPRADLAREIEHVRIADLGEAGYGIRKTIPVEITRIEAGNFEASFREANIAISGVDSDDAYQALVAGILDTFDVLVQEPTLGPDAAEQLRILRTYIVRT